MRDCFLRTVSGAARRGGLHGLRRTAGGVGRPSRHLDGGGIERALTCGEREGALVSCRNGDGFLALRACDADDQLSGIRAGEADQLRQRDPACLLKMRRVWSAGGMTAMRICGLS